jgi:hypothetical protein
VNVVIHQTRDQRAPAQIDHARLKRVARERGGIKPGDASIYKGDSVRARLCRVEGVNLAIG